MLRARAARWRRSLSRLLALTVAMAAAAALAAGPAGADSVRDAQQWVLDAVNVPAAWPVSQGQGVLVAVIDSGVQPDVADLSGSVTTGPDYSGVSTKPADPNWGMHGTWMASLIAGHGHAGDSGISGVAPRARVLSIRVLPDKKDPAYAQYQREPSSSAQRALAKAIRYAVAHRAGVISMSLGYGASSGAVKSALQDALRHKVVVIASSGNSGQEAGGRGRSHAPDSFPADYPGVLGVAAVDRAGAPARFSSDNLSVQVAAPGVQVPAEGGDGQYWLVSGTSPACALTSGVAALIKSAYPRLAPALIVRAITSSAQHRPPGGYDDRVGFGTVDAAAALTAAARLTRYRPAGRGLRPAGHFGGGPAAIPPAPIQPRGLGQLVLFCLLAAGCLAITVTAASRLVLARGRGGVSQADPGGQELTSAWPAGGVPDGAGQNGAVAGGFSVAGQTRGSDDPAGVRHGGAGPASGVPNGGASPVRHAAPKAWSAFIWPPNRVAAARQEVRPLGHATPGHPAPEHAVPEHAVPEHAVPEHAVPEHAAPGPVEPEHAVPEHAAPGQPQPGPGDGQPGSGDGQ
jgi:hypothetical protein